MWNGEVNQLTQTQKNEQNNPSDSSCMQVVRITYLSPYKSIFINRFHAVISFVSYSYTWHVLTLGIQAPCAICPVTFPALSLKMNIVYSELRQFKLCRLYPFAGIYYRRRRTTKNTRLFQERNKQGFHVATKISTWNQFSLKYSGRQGNPSYHHDNRFRSLMILTETEAVLW